MREQYIEGIPYISKEQFYKMAHIRKSTALKLIRTGTVPAIDTGRTTNRYLIRLSDVEFYLRDRIVNLVFKPIRVNTTGASRKKWAFVPLICG